MVPKSKHKAYLFDDTPKGILEALLVAGGIAAALTFAPTLFVALAAVGYVIQAEDRERRKKLQRSFQYLTRHKYVRQYTDGTKIKIALTARGRSRITHHLQRHALYEPVEKPQVWDNKWRLILFDIPAAERSKRNAFRSFIRRLGARMLQKSVWVHPFDCAEHISLLRSIFVFSDEQLRLVVCDSIGDDAALRRYFKVR